MSVFRLIGFLLFFAGAGYAIFLSVQDEEARSIIATASQLELGRKVSDEELARAADIVLQADFGRSCRSEILRPGLTIVLFNLNRTNAAVNYDAWLDAHARSEAYLDHMARCLPADGNVWLRSAIVSRSVAEDGGDLKRRMTLATQRMPYEGQQIIGRLFLWKSLSATTLLASADLARADIRTVLLYGTPQQNSALDGPASTEFLRLVADERQRSKPGGAAEVR